MDEALPGFLQTAWSYVVRDIDSTMKQVGRTAFVLCLCDSVSASPYVVRDIDSTMKQVGRTAFVPFMCGLYYHFNNLRFGS